MPKQNEAELSNDFRAALRGDEAAYRRFLCAITPVIQHIVQQKMSTDQEDTVQDILYALHLKRHTWKTDQPVLPWVYAITRYRCIDVLRKKSRIRTTPIDHVTEEHFAIEDDHTTAIDLPNAIARLDGRVGKVAKAMGLEGKSVRETGTELGMTENAVRIAFHRAIKKLREAAI